MSDDIQVNVEAALGKMRDEHKIAAGNAAAMEYVLTAILAKIANSTGSPEEFVREVCHANFPDNPTQKQADAHELLAASLSRIEKGAITLAARFRG